MEVMLAKKYENQPINGWFMSEKIDGCRAIWTGTELQSKNGLRFNSPAWFTSQLPAGIMLDGELHAGRNTFQQCVGTVRKKKPIDAEWKNIQYSVFDAPEYDGDFVARIAYCKSVLAGCQVANVLTQTKCANTAKMVDFFTAMVTIEAEGIMLRNPESRYEEGRSNDMLKVKPTQTEEALVIGHQAGEGKHFEKLGALVCKWKNGLFNLGTGFTDEQREFPPSVGSIITFRFNGLTDGKIPRFPVFLAVRDYE